MKSRIIATLIFLSTMPLLSFAQQTDSQAARQLDPVQLFDIQRGEVEHFKTLAYRFEVAWEENDVQSMSDLRNGLFELMEVEIEQNKAKGDLSKAAQERIAAQQECAKKIKALPLTTTEGAFGKKAEQAKTVFNDFIKLLETDLTAQVEALRPAAKQ